MSLERKVSGRSRPMEVLVLGLCRTGTMSTQKALEILGYDKVYNYSEAVKTSGHPEKWIAALEAKFEGKGSEYSREQWDDLLGEYNAVRDIPASCFSSELLKAYPDAKVILTRRSPDSWYQSVNGTIWAFQNNIFRKFDRVWYSAQLKAAAKLMDRIFDIYFYGNFPRFGKRVFNEHNERVRSLVPPERLLEFYPSDGWGPLCEFLEKDIPLTEFPKVNETAAWKELLGAGKLWKKVKVISIGMTLIISIYLARQAF